VEEEERAPSPDPFHPSPVSAHHACSLSICPFRAVDVELREWKNEQNGQESGRVASHPSMISHLFISFFPPHAVVCPGDKFQDLFSRPNPDPPRSPLSQIHRPTSNRGFCHSQRRMRAKNDESNFLPTARCGEAALRPRCVGISILPRPSPRPILPDAPEAGRPRTHFLGCRKPPSAKGRTRSSWPLSQPVTACSWVGCVSARGPE